MDVGESFFLINKTELHEFSCELSQELLVENLKIEPSSKHEITLKLPSVLSILKVHSHGVKGL